MKMMKVVRIWLLILCWGCMNSTILLAQQIQVTDTLNHTTLQYDERELKTLADSAYVVGDYLQAIALYESIIDNHGEAAAIYYNLANSYYKQSEIAKAIVNYERALLLDPADEDIRFNLEWVRNKTIDKITPKSQIFFISWMEDFVNLYNTNTWAIIAISSFIIAIIGFTFYLFGRVIRIRKISFSISILGFILCLISNFASDFQKDKLECQDYAIIMHPTITAKSTPDKSGTDLFVLHEGCKVKIKDNSMQEWKEIELEDGNIGWIPTSALEII